MLIRIFSLVVILLFVICHLSFTGAMSRPADGGSSRQEVFLGVFREGAPANMNYLLKFEEQAGKKPAMVMWYQDWAQNFPREAALNVIEYGAVPHIVWEPWYWSDHSKVQLNDIIDGKWDNYIRTWAQEIRNFKRPVFLRFAHEFNIEGYPWGIINNEKDPQIYVKAYRRVVDIFKKEGAKNAKWVWCFMNYSHPNESWNDWAAAYPGNDCVDWIGIDGYNWGTTQSWSEWGAFKYMFRDQMRRARKLWPSKPIMIAEFASAEKGGDKAAWLKEIPGYLRTSMRDIDCIVWFDLKKETDWRINSSPKALEAFKEIMKDPMFLSSGEALEKFTVPVEKIVKRRAYALRAGKPLVINGDLSEWNKSEPIAMKDISFFKEGVSWGGLQDLSGSAYIMWDNENFYLAAEISDKIPMINKQQGGNIWNGDAIEIVMGLDSDADPARERFGRGDYQIGFGAGDGKENPPSIWSWQRRRVPAGSEIMVKKTESPQGYILEARIPWEFFRSKFVPASGAKIGFDIAFDDADQTGVRERQFIWNGDYYFYGDPGVWGILELK